MKGICNLLWSGFAASLICIATLYPLATPAQTAADVPAVKLLKAPLTSPSDAWDYYGNSTVHTNGVAYSATRAPEIREIAKALGAGRLATDEYTSAVYKYVRDNIKPDFRFGLSKGASGAIIDQSGTAFDQAQLMVELLREGGVTAGYVIGTIGLSNAEFTAWSGVSGAKAVCQFLADGGIPAEINSSTNCENLGTGNFLTLRMAHIWVSANSKKYDPAYKEQIQKSGIDLAAAMGCGTQTSPTCGSAILNSVPAVGIYPGTTNVTYVQNANSTSIDAQLKAYATNLESRIKSDSVTTKNNLQIEDIVGGLKIDASAAESLSGFLCVEPYTALRARKDVWQRKTRGRFRPSCWTRCWRGVTPRRFSIQAA